MDDFLPSEVARLVLGYLKEVKCNKSWETFLGENPSLQEYYCLYKNGNVYCTNVGEKSLLEILRFYRSLKKYGKKIVKEIKRCEKEYNSNPDKIQDIIDEIASMVSLTFQKYLSLSNDKSDCPDSNPSSNIASSVTENSDNHNQTFSLAEINKYADECTEIDPCDLSAKVTTEQISKINEIGDSTANVFALQEVPSDNNSSCLNSEYDLRIVKRELDSDLSDNETIVSDTSANISALQEVPSNDNGSSLNSEHDLKIIKSELDSHVSDNEMNVSDTSTIISLNTSDLHPINNMPLEHSNTDNKFVSPENNQSSQKEEECTLNVPSQLSSLTNSCSSVENTTSVATDTEMTDKTETTNENPVFVVVSNDMNCLNATVQSKKQGVCEANGNTTVNECQDVVKSTDNFILMNNSQYSTVISPPNQPGALLSYTAIPGFTMPNTSSDLSGQNNIGYQIVLNAPIGWNVPITNGLSLVPPQGLSFVPSLPLSSVSKSPVISPASKTAVPTPLLSNVPKQAAFAASSSAVLPTLPLTSAASQALASSTSVSSHIANFETTVSDNLHDKTKSVPIIKKTIKDLKKSNDSKQKANKKKDDKNESKPTTGRRPYSKRLPKRKRPSLFSSPPKPKEDPPAEKIPVSSIAESPCKLSAPYTTKLTDDFADHCKSPELKLLMTSAKELLKASNRTDLSHARCLDFNSKAAASDEILIIDEINKLQENNKSETLPEMVVRNEVQNSKSLTNGNAHNEQCMSKVTNKASYCGENSKKRTISDTPSKSKKAKLQKQYKRKKGTSKKSKTPQKVEKMDVIPVAPISSFQLKTYENLNKNKNHKVVKEIVAREPYKKGSESQNEKVTLESVITTATEKNNNKVQNKKFTLDESTRKSRRIAGKMTSASSNEFPIGERKEFQNESSDHSMINTVLQNAVSEYRKVEVTSKNPLSPQRSKENEHCETKCRLIIVNVMQNKKSPQKSDKLQDKKTENTDKSPFKKNESQNTNGKDVIISLNKINESVKTSDEATHSTSNCNVSEIFRENVEKTANNEVEKSQNFNKMIAFDNGSELKTIINNNKNPVEEIEYPTCNDIKLDGDNIQLKKKILFNDPGFKFQEVNKHEQICLMNNS